MDMDVDHHGQEAVLKFVFLGEPGVGKTSIIQRYLSDRFSGDGIQTSGVEFHRKRISFPGNVDVSLHIWDTGGTALLSPMLSSYLHEAHVLVFVYDVTNTTSFTKLGDWFEAIRQHPVEDGKKKANPYLALVGNKGDLQHLRTIKAEKAAKFAQDHGIVDTCVVSAQGNDGIHVLFRKITATVLGLRLGRADFEQDIVAAQNENDIKKLHTTPAPEIKEVSKGTRSYPSAPGCVAVENGVEALA